MAKSLTRAEIRRIVGEGCTDEIVTALMEAHHGVVDEIRDLLDAARDEAAKYKAEADRVPGLRQELEQLQGGEDFRAKYDKEHQDFEAYKKQIADGEELTRKKAAFRRLLSEERVSDKRLDAVIRLTDFSRMKLDKEGNLEGADDLRAGIREDWAEYITTERTDGAKPGSPPSTDSSGFGAMTLAQKMAYANAHPGAPEVVAWLQK